MAIKLNNRFSKNTEKNAETINKLREKKYSSSYKEEILDKNSETLPLLAIANCTILIGSIEKGEFSEWLDKKHIASVTADVLRPESALIAIILSAINLYPKPSALLDRLIERLMDIRKMQDSKIDTTKTSKVC